MKSMDTGVLKCLKHLLLFVNTSSGGEIVFDDRVTSPAGVMCNRLKACAIICLQQQLITRLFKFSEEVALKHSSYFFTVLCASNTAPLGPPQLGASFVCSTATGPAGGPVSCHGIEADGHSVTSLAGNTIITSHIHLKAGTNT